MKFMSRLAPLSLLALRGAIGLVFLYHGYPKLVHPTEGMRTFFMSHGFPSYFVEVSGILEFFGALLLIVGLFTRPAALLLTIEMIVAIVKVHSGHGIYAVREYELPLALAAASFVLATIGAGVASTDHLVFGEGGKTRRG